MPSRAGHSVILDEGWVVISLEDLARRTNQGKGSLVGSLYLHVLHANLVLASLYNYGLSFRSSKGRYYGMSFVVVSCPNLDLA